MKKIFTILIISIFLLIIPGCMTVHLTVEGYDKPVSMTNNVNKNFVIVKHFKRELKAVFVIFNLVTVSNPQIEKVIRNEVLSAQGDAAINVKIQGQITFVDGFVPVALGVIGAVVAPPYGAYISNLIGLRTYTVEGDIIKYTD